MSAHSREFRQKWSHAPTPIPPEASGLWYSEECVDEMLDNYAANIRAELKLKTDHAWEEWSKASGRAQAYLKRAEAAEKQLAETRAEALLWKEKHNTVSILLQDFIKDEKR